jgi:HEPN domain-containing protein
VLYDRPTGVDDDLDIERPIDRTDMVEFVRDWVKKAENDLLNAEIVLPHEPCPFDTVAFHAQQCAEKYLKALLSWRLIDFERTHELGKLIDRPPADVAVPLTKTEARLLSRYGAQGRYPTRKREDKPQEPIPYPTRVSAERYVAQARAVREAIRPLLLPR